MRTFLRALALPALASVLAIACSSGTPEDDVTADDLTAATDCTASFTWFQKDAYKDTGGRTTPGWPPHTTTQLQLTCNVKGKSRVVTTNAQGNHGSLPGVMDSTGKRLLLDPVKTDTVKGTQKQLAPLLDAYKTCECEPAKFFSLDVSRNPEAQGLLDEALTIIETSVKCGGAGAKALADDLRAGKFEEALAIVPLCQFPNGDAASVMTQAITELGKKAQKSFADYHVCNNDAALQAAQFANFQSKRVATKCDQKDAICIGPRFFYTP